MPRKKFLRYNRSTSKGENYVLDNPRSGYRNCALFVFVLHFHRKDHKEGLATYFREFMRQYVMAKKPNPVL